jgi:hypothetical protein
LTLPTELGRHLLGGEVAALVIEQARADGGVTLLVKDVGVFFPYMSKTAREPVTRVAMNLITGWATAPEANSTKATIRVRVMVSPNSWTCILDRW